MTIDELARRAATPVRTIREYQTIGVLPAPDRRGRVGIYARSHVTRLALIARLQRRGYSLAGIRDLLSSWRDGADLGELLGLEPDQLVHVDEPGAPATLEQLARLLPAGSGAITRPARDGRHRGLRTRPLLRAEPVVVATHGRRARRRVSRGSRGRSAALVGHADDSIADAVLSTLRDRPAGRAAALAARGRGLLAHGVGRLTIHTLGRRLGVTDESDVADAVRQFVEAERHA